MHTRRRGAREQYSMPGQASDRPPDKEQQPAPYQPWHYSTRRTACVSLSSNKETFETFETKVNLPSLHPGEMRKELTPETGSF